MRATRMDGACPRRPAFEPLDRPSAVTVNRLFGRQSVAAVGDLADAFHDAAPSTSDLGNRWSGAGGLEELDRVARGVFEQDLPAAGAADDVVAERQAGGPQPLDLGRDVVDDEVDAVPASRLRGAAVWHRAAGRALRAA